MRNDLLRIFTGAIILFVGATASQPACSLRDIVDVRDHGRLLRIVGEDEGDLCGIFIEVADLVGDSRPDLLVSSSNAEDPADDYRGGRVDLFDGSTLPDVGLIDLEDPIPRPWMTIYGEKDDGLFGSRIEIADFDGDGESDLAISAPYFRGTGESDSGRTYIFFNKTNQRNFFETKDEVFAADADVFIDGAEKGERVGRFMTSGDFDGDGRADLVLGAPESDERRPDESGRVYVVHGRADWSAQPIISLKDALEPESASPALTFDTQIRAYTGEREFDRIGEALEAGDLNGDNLSDLAIGGGHADIVVKSNDVATTLDVGKVHVISGTDVFSNPPYEGEIILSASNTTRLLIGKSEHDMFGDNMFVTRWDGDSIDDLWVSAPFAEFDPKGNTNDDFGIVSLLLGAPAFLNSATGKGAPILNFSRGWMDPYHEAPDLLAQLKSKIPVNTQYPDGHSLAVVGPEDEKENETLFGGTIWQGDVLDNDGVTELIVGASLFDSERSSRTAGAVCVLTRDDLAGSVPASPRHLGVDPESVRIEGEEGTDRFGFRVRSADLLSGPGEELIVSAPRAESDVRVAGVVYIFNLDETAYDASATASPTYAITVTPVPTYTRTPAPAKAATRTPTPAPYLK